MTRISKFARPMSLVFVLACAHEVDPRPIPPVGLYALQLNGKFVNVPITNSLFEALRRLPSASLLSEVSGAETSPLYVIDGTQVLDGLRVIARMPVCDTESVELLRPIRAVALYGERASAGAIVVRTRRGGSRARLLIDGPRSSWFRAVDGRGRAAGAGSGVAVRH